MADNYNLEIYEEGSWQVICAKRTKVVVDYWANFFLRANPEAELVIVPVKE